MIGLAMFLPLIETNVNHYLSLDPESRARLLPLTDKIIRFEVEGLNFNFYLTTHESKVRLFEEFQGEPHTTFIGRPISLLRLSLNKAASKNFHDSGVKIQGDVELGQQLKDVFDGMEIDWEDYLSNITGDVMAHQMGNMFKNVYTYGQTAADSLSKNFTEYMQEEVRHFPPREEVNDFLAEIDTLRNDVERLEIKIKFL